MDRAALRMGARAGVRLRRIESVPPQQLAELGPSEPRSPLGEKLRQIIAQPGNDEPSHLDDAVAQVESGVSDVEAILLDLRAVTNKLGGIGGDETAARIGQSIPVAAESQIGRLLLAAQRHRAVVDELRAEISRLRGLV